MRSAPQPAARWPWMTGACLLALSAVAQGESLSAPLRHGEVIHDMLRDGSQGPAMVFIRGGAYIMGSLADETGRDGEERRRRAVVADVLIARTELTVHEFRQFVWATGYDTDAERNAGGRRGCYAWDNADSDWTYRARRHWLKPGVHREDDYPAVCLSWNDAQAYAAWLSAQTGEAYRLPTEAEWEYAARAGTRTARFWGNDPAQACTYGNVADRATARSNRDWTIGHDCEDGFGTLAPVARFAPNPWGLYDMLGNAWEWTCSAYDSAYLGAQERCDAWAEHRASRGGSWINGADGTRVADRARDLPTDRTNYAGLRLARSL